MKRYNLKCFCLTITYCYTVCMEISFLMHYVKCTACQTLFTAQYSHYNDYMFRKSLLCMVFVFFGVCLWMSDVPCIIVIT